ncbi:hypothetical protein ACA910_008086 [Epithemia clementina (nom. ined.)]
MAKRRCMLLVAAAVATLCCVCNDANPVFASAFSLSSPPILRRTRTTTTTRSSTPTSTLLFQSSHVSEAKSKASTSRSQPQQQDQQKFKGFGNAPPQNIKNKNNSPSTTAATTSSSSSATASSSTASTNDTASSTDKETDGGKAILDMSLEEAKSELLALLPSMTGQAHEYRRVEILVNTLESLYQPVQTLDFWNLLQQGEWQLLFSTNMVNNQKTKGIVNPLVFRMRELYHTMQCAQRKGNWTTHVVWDLADEVPGRFDCTGTFTVQSSYEMAPQGSARFAWTLQDHVLQPAKGQKRLPHDCQALVGLLYRAMPTQVFDPSNHSADTTYVDATLKILRYTGPQHEGVRDIWIRRGALQINPTSTTTTTAKSTTT